MKILIIALSGIGDALMFTPALKHLRKAFPGSRIDAMVMFSGVKDIYNRNKNLDNVYHFNFIKEGAVKSLFYLLKFRGKYDVAINVYPSNRKEYNLFSFILGAKKRAAVDYLRMNKENLGFLNNLTITEDDSIHNVEENLKLVEKITGTAISSADFPLEFPLSEDDCLYSDNFFKTHNITGKEIVIGFHPGCATLKNHIKRRWEPEKFSELGKLLINKHNARILVFGGPEETELKNNVIDGIGMKSVIAVNTENLAQTAAIIKRCNLLITNDSSLMHVSSAMQQNVIAIIGPTNPNYIHPWQTNHKIVTLNLECAPCFFYSPKPLTCYRTDLEFKCIKGLTVDMVYKAAEEFLTVQ